MGLTVDNTLQNAGFIPEIWSGKAIEGLYDSTFLSDITNTDYEGEISSYGDTVHIKVNGSVTIRDYVPGQNLQTETPSNGKITLNIDKAKYFNFGVNDVIEAQSSIKDMEAYKKDAGERMKIEIEKDLLGNVYADAHTSNAGANAGDRSGLYNMGATGAPVALDKDNILDFISDMASVLEENNMYHDGAFILMPPAIKNLIMKSEIRDASYAGSADILKGRLGMIDKFTIYSSNLVDMVEDNGDKAFNMMFGHKDAITFASQMTDVETLKNPNDFGDLVRGNNVYGYKVVRPEGLGHAYVKRA